MIYPRKNRLKRWMLDVYIGRLIKKHFHTVQVESVEIGSDRPVLLIANHFSVWDGMLLYHLNHKITGKQFHVMLLEETARREPMLKYAGAFSVNKGGRDVMESLNFAAGLLCNVQNMVLIFPQGKLYSNFSDTIRFEKGLLKIINQIPKDYELLMAATFVESFEHKKPTASIYLKKASHTQFANISELEALYQEHYAASKHKQAEKTV